MLAKIQKILGADKAIIWSLIGYGITAITGPITAFVIASQMSSVAQGYYYTFGSLLGLQIFLELGFSVCIVQFISHEFAHLKWTKDGRLEGDTMALGKLISISKLSVKWYTAAALLFLIIVGLSGEIFFRNNQHDVVWRLPWWLLCLGSTIGLLTLPLGAILDGCNLISWTAKARMIQNTLRSSILVLIVVLGGGLYAPGVSVLVSSLFLLSFIVIKWSPILAQINAIKSKVSVSWRHDILPLQWRIAVSWISGYLIFCSFNPIIFSEIGAKEAGQFGITWTILMAMSGVSQVYISTKAPIFGMHNSRNELVHLRSIWLAALVRSLITSCLLVVVYYIGLLLLKKYTGISHRFLEWNLTIPLVIAMIFNQFTFAVAGLARSEKKEPFLWVSVCGGVFVISGNLVLIKPFGIFGLGVVYLLSAVVSAAFAYKILRNTSAFKVTA